MANPTQTTLSGAILVNQTQFAVASTSNIAAPTNGQFQKIYVLDPGQTRGELMIVTGVPSSGVVQVSRLDEFKSPHVSGAIVIIQAIDVTLDPVFIERDPQVVPITAPTQTMVVNVTNGRQWLYSSVTGTLVPGFGNTAAPQQCTAAVTATAAVLPAPSGPLFHVAASGTPAVTGITMPTGFAGGAITIIPDAAFTWTAPAGASTFAVSGTAVALKALTCTYDWATALWYPSYVA
jgi:hypothetical protein